MDQAVHFQEQHLSIAASTNDQLAKTVAYSALGRVHQLLGNRTQAVAYLTQGLCIAEMLGRRDEEVCFYIFTSMIQLKNFNIIFRLKFEIVWV